MSWTFFYTFLLRVVHSFTEEYEEQCYQLFVKVVGKFLVFHLDFYVKLTFCKFKET